MADAAPKAKKPRRPAKGGARKALAERRPPANVLKALDDRHYLFIERYLVHRNASLAVRETQPDVTFETSHALGSKLLSQPLIDAEIRRRTDEVLARYRLEADHVLSELALVAFANIKDCFDDEGRLKPMKDIPREVAAAIKAKKETLYGTQFELHDKLGALHKLGIHHGLFVERVEVTTGEERLKLLREARERSVKR